MIKHDKQFKKGMIPWNKGMKMSNEYRKKLSKIHKENPNKYWLGKKRPEASVWFKKNKGKQSNEKHWNWKGGINPKNDTIRKSIEYKIWRELVYERDDWTCQKCSVRGGDIHSHHIFNFSKNDDLRFNIDNGVTLCRKCHYKFHTLYGFNNNNSEHLQSFLGCVASVSEA